MRILHFADLHLGVENYGRVDPATGLHSRLLDFLRSFDFIIETALARKVDLALFCGDAFRSREPSPTLQCLFAERIRRLADAGIPVLLLVGNHDLPPLPGRSSSLEIYPILEVPGVEVVTRPGLRRIQTPSGPIQVACLPAGEWQAERLPDEPRAQSVIEELAYEVKVDAPALLAAHAGVRGARIGSEGLMGLGRENSFPMEALARPEFCYVALGHVHSFQDANPRRSPPVVYCGSPERVDFSEENEPKGFVIVEISESVQQFNSSTVQGTVQQFNSSTVQSPEKEPLAALDAERSTEGCAFPVRYEFVETPARRFLTIDLCLEPGAGTVDVLDAIAPRPVDDAVVKLVLRSLETIALDEKEIRRALESAAYLTRIVKEIERPPARLRAPGLSRSWDDPLTALEEYLKTTQFSDDRKAQLRAAAAKLVKSS